MKKAASFKSYILYSSLAISTVLMVFISTKFAINDFVSHPQFENFIHFDRCIQLIQNKDKTTLFNAFFILDFIWAPLLLISMYKIIIKLNKGFRNRNALFFIIFSIIAYAFDVMENTLYLLNNSKYLEKIVSFKKIAYLLAAIVLLYNLYKRYVHDKNRNIYFFLKTSFLSILIILVITVLITMVDQGGTILVELISTWHQVLLTFFLLNFLVVIISHYPIYMQIWNVLDKPFAPDGLRLVMSKLNRVILGFGIIYFIPQGDKEYDPFITKFLRRSLGILLYMSMFYVVLFTSNKYFEWDYDTAKLTGFITILLLMFFYYMEKRKERHDDILDGKKEGDKWESAKQLTRLLKWYPQVLLAGLLSVILATIISAIFEWNRTTIIVILTVLFLNTLSYIYFRLSRSYLRYIFYSEALQSSNPHLIDEKVLKYFSNSNKASYPFFSDLIFRTGQFLAYLSDNRKYLRFMRVGGLLSLLFIFFINLIPLYGFVFNPLNVILLYIIFYYSVIIILLKHLLFYNKTVVTDTTNTPFSSFLSFQPIFKYLFPILMVVLVGWGFYSTSVGNDLHTLTLIPENQDASIPLKNTNDPSLINIKTFVEQYDPIIRNDTVNTFFVASYGGGLKANLWNLLVLNELNRDSNFFKNTLCFSGVSGGALGIGNYLRIHDHYATFEERNIANIRVGESNLLSTEIAYLLGADLFRRYIPIDNLFSDRGRSYYSMKQHALHTGDLGGFNTISFRSKWSELFRKENYFPAVIINATSTKGKQGVSLSIFTKDTVVPAADDILLFEDRKRQESLSYYGALSTSNRFPFLSPAAKIEGKGYYLDGGYFENSGLLSAGEFRDYILPNLKEKKKLDSVLINPIFVNIINSKDYYALRKIKEWGVELNPENGLTSGELSAILSTLISTEKLPRYVTESIIGEGEEGVEKIFMPHKLDYKYVTKILGGEPKNPLKLIEHLEIHNKTIDKALESYHHYNLNDWGIVTPPLSRLLGEVAVKYQEAMINKHPAVMKQIAKLKSHVRPE
ncbi:patatin-like phospholipase family protein [Ascidiimonas sp. W6]|uniref:patatin-like phospholipase family protein n=1 Tax=Ascidiimonas meishanensis TaxID=3128903 RepID=UPI0030ECF94B